MKSVSLTRRFFELAGSMSIFFMLYSIFVPLPNKYACIILFSMVTSYIFWRRRDGERSLSKHLMFSAMVGFGFYYVYSAVSTSSIFFYGIRFNVNIYSSILQVLPVTTYLFVLLWDELFNEEGRYRRKVYFNLDHRGIDETEWREQIKVRSKNEMLVAYSKESAKVAKNKARLLGLQKYFTGFRSEEEKDKEVQNRDTMYEDSIVNME